MTVSSEDVAYFRVMYSPDGGHVVCGMNKGEVRILDSNNGAKVRNVRFSKAQESSLVGIPSQKIFNSSNDPT